MSEPTTSTTHLDCTAHAHRLEAVLARVVRERDALVRELAALRDRPVKCCDATSSAACECRDAGFEEGLAVDCDECKVLRAELAALRASPSPSAVAVPEVVVQQGHGKYGAGLWHVRVNGINVGQSDNSNTADHWAEMIRDALKAALPHADAGGEAITRLANEKIWLEDTLADALAAGLNESENLRAEIRVRRANEARRIEEAAEAARRAEREACADIPRKMALGGNTDTEGSPAAVRALLTAMGRILDRAAEREKTETAGATPAPCPRCKGDGELKMSVGTYKKCPDCSGTSRAPASSPAPAAPEARWEDGVEVRPSENYRGQYGELVYDVFALGFRVAERLSERAAKDMGAGLLANLRAERALARDAAWNEAIEAAAKKLEVLAGTAHANVVRSLRGKAESGEGGKT